MSNQKAKSDAGKPKLSLVPRRIIFDIARIREYGNNKYPEGGIDNWRLVEPERYRDAAFRHFLAYLDDPYGVDDESGLPHLWHLACNVAFLCDLEDTRTKLTKSELNYIHHDEEAVLGFLGKVTDHKDGSIGIKLTEEGEEAFRTCWKKLIDEGFYDD